MRNFYQKRGKVSKQDREHENRENVSLGPSSQTSVGLTGKWYVQPPAMANPLTNTYLALHRAPRFSGAPRNRTVKNNAGVDDTRGPRILQQAVNAAQIKAAREKIRGSLPGNEQPAEFATFCA